MKRFLTNLIGCAVATFSLLATACTPDDSEKNRVPNFPTAVTAEVEAGSTYTLSIKPNMAWSVSIPDEAVAYFSILDGDAEVYSVNGEAGSYDVVIKVTDIRDYNASHVCEVKMTMGDREQTVATLTLGQVIRSIKIYNVLFEDNGDWMYGAQTMYEYSDEQVGTEGIELKWGENGLDMFCHRVKIVSNFNWKIDGTPAWIQAINNNTEDVTELWIKGDAENYPMEDATATLSFLDADDNTIEPVATLNVSITSVNNIFQIEEFDTEYTFNHEGKLYNIFSASYEEGNAEGSVISANEELHVYTVSFEEMPGGFITPSFDNEWINYEVSSWDTTDNAKIQYRNISIGVTANEDSDRQAMVVVIPKSVAEANFADINEPYEILEQSSTGMGASGKLLAEYQKYHATTIKQLEAPGLITLNNASELKTVLWQKVGAGSDISYDFPDVRDGYELLYTNQWDSDDASFSFNGTYTSVEYCYYDSNSGNMIIMSEDESWISVNPFGENGFKLVMEPTADTYKHWNTESYYNGAYWSYVVFKNNDEIVAVISCLHNLDYDLTGGGSTDNAGLSFSYPDYATNNDGSTLQQITSGEYYQMIVGNFGEMPVWHLTYTKTPATMSGISGINPEWIPVFVDEADKEWLSFELGEMATIAMNESGNGKTGIILFKDSNNIPQLALVCTLNIAQ